MMVMVEYRAPAAMYDIYLYFEMDGGKQMFYPQGCNPGGGQAVEVAHGAEPPVWVSLSAFVAEKLADAILPRPDVTARHLDDAIAVRDRLLVLVEQSCKP